MGTHPIKIDRRDFLKTSAVATGGLLLGFGPADSKAQFGPPQPITPGAFIHIGSDDIVTLVVHKPENGQGAETAIAMLLAEELDCDWNQIRTEFAPIAPIYGGALQGTFGSMGVRTSFEPMRRTGAAAKQMLIEAAAERWGIDAAACHADNGAVVNGATGARLRYGELAEAAALRSVPAEIRLKPASEFRLVGKPVPRRDTVEKITGRATYGIDVVKPGTVYATVQRCPVFGGTLASFDAARAKAVPGVKDVFAIPQGVAVIADNTYAALEGRRLLDVTWNEGENASLSTASIHERLGALIEQPGAVASNTGDAAAALDGAAQRLEAYYDAPYLAHAPMEPFSAVAIVTDTSCEVWTGTQIPGLAHSSAVEASGLSADQVKIHTLYMGGGFGSRGGGSWVAETVEIAKRAGVPVKLMWSREDDLQHDRYRPASRVKLAAGLDADGWPVAWTGCAACSSFAGLRNGVDREGVADLANPHYAIPNVHFEYHEPGLPIPTNYWRSVGHSQNTFFAESFVDELAVAAGKDPVEYRRALLVHNPRLLNVLELAAERANWGGPLAAGGFHGVAVTECFGSYNAQVAEVSVANGRVRVHKVTCVVDCGTAV
ncbi:MAG: molybdopterin cofactor-binding domain-containing protein, partial [Gammaproteobacteria bacterium]|nr:molybdopterin cofactor-binding domain-containing protein [Gammaproteobacteria bacterium]